MHVDAAIAVATLSGTWRDSAGNSGAFAFTPGPGSGGSARPTPAPTVPLTIQLRPDGGVLASGTLDTGTIPASGAGVRMMWHPAKAAFRAGQVASNNPASWDNPNVGAHSVAFGLNATGRGLGSTATGVDTTAGGSSSVAMGAGTSASGVNSTALGAGTIASGPASTAMGVGTTASGNASTALGESTTALLQASTAMGFGSKANGFFSTAMGFQTEASGNSSTAMGANTKATGPVGTAMGDRTTASGDAATALGSQTTASGKASLAAGEIVSAGGRTSVALGSRVTASTAGTFMFGDQSTPNPMLTFVPNQFLVRAAGGTTFYSNAALTTGVDLLPNANAWSSASDVRLKHRFRDLDGDEVLAKLAGMSIQEWSYTAQDASIRHVGPTAQEFYAAFGLGEHPLRISTIDADGIALRAIQALVHEIAVLRERVAQIEAQQR